MKQHPLMWLITIIAVVAAAYFAQSAIRPSADPHTVPQIDLIVGGPDPFWQLVIAGAESAASRYDAKLNVHVPEGTGKAQTEVITRLDTNSSDGIAVSPLAPIEQTNLLARNAAKVNLVTYDNDSPHSQRLCYIGSNNWTAGQQCAEILKQALPDGGNVAVFVGDNERQNAKRRILGLMAGLADRSTGTSDTEWNMTDPIEINGYTLLRCYLDGSDHEQAKANAAQALVDHPDLQCMVGLYGYSGPMCLEALKEADKLGEVKLVAFDEFEATLAGIEAGHIAGTVVQDPYQFGFESVRLLADISRKPEESAPVPGSGTLYIPCSIVNAENLAEFKAQLKQRIGAVDTAGAESG